MKKGSLTASIAVVLMLASLLNVQRVSRISEVTVNYGYPLAWLDHYVFGVVPLNQWFPNPVGLILDFLFWLAISFAIVSITAPYAEER